MAEEPIKAIHDLERVIRVWELVRDCEQQTIDKATRRRWRRGQSGEASPEIANARSQIAACNASILAVKARINELAGGKQKDK
jgi:hypothetical protein